MVPANRNIELASSGGQVKKRDIEVPVNGMKAQRGVEVRLHSFHISTLSEGEW